jgi:HEPN domain-containing protein
MKETARPWIEFARRDLAVAEAIKDNEYIANAVMYHCQQVVEKAFKAIFEEHGLRIPRIHSLTQLFSDLTSRKLLPASGISPKDLLFLDQVYLDSRYPGGLGLLPHGFPLKEEANEALGIARRILETVMRSI